jgi:hypothetical protein
MLTLSYKHEGLIVCFQLVMIRILFDGIFLPAYEADHCSLSFDVQQTVVGAKPVVWVSRL